MVLPPSPVLLLNPVGFIFWVAKILRYQLLGQGLTRKARFQEFCTRHGYYFRSAMAVFIRNRLEDGKQENLFNDLINRVYFAVAVLVCEDVDLAYFQIVVTDLLEDNRDDHHTLTLPIIARLFGKSTPQSYVTKLVKHVPRRVYREAWLFETSKRKLARVRRVKAPTKHQDGEQRERTAAHEGQEGDRAKEEEEAFLKERRWDGSLSKSKNESETVTFWILCACFGAASRHVCKCGFHQSRYVCTQVLP